ncbi:hypothetical protein BN2475_380112 [Paraburkholderia ribeironis]|uniref:Uncharacterized protein n=1 Tax=Paraburkholderia ribeironis TaxID=1247936 RepID=A0A1N7S739_9BURK|nr:hypothetical protein BN2475_380112 [Paraburkholderia ribeironis]
MARHDKARLGDGRLWLQHDARETGEAGCRASLAACDGGHAKRQATCRGVGQRARFLCVMPGRAAQTLDRGGDAQFNLAGTEAQRV